MFVVLVVFWGLGLSQRCFGLFIIVVIVFSSSGLGNLDVLLNIPVVVLLFAQQ